MPSHILVVEDNDLEQQALKAAFEKEGYVVDSASDGLSALRKLRSGGYDLALVDYRIPEVDGLASAKLLHEMMDETSLPKLVAITGASSELKERQGDTDVFDAIISKPYDLGEVIKVVGKEIKRSHSSARSAAADEIWRSFGLARRPAAVIKPLPNSTDTKVFQNLFDLRGDSAPDVIVLASPSAYDEISNLRENTDWYRCPVIDATGEFGALADATLTHFNRETLKEIANTILRFKDRFHRLAPEYQYPATLAERLLAYLFLSGKELRAERFAQSKAFVRYTGFFSPLQVIETAEQLRHSGLLERTFFDRVHVCDSCGSARLNAREECPSCRSSHLRREAIIHHFRCAWQAPESQFRQGRDLVCPKCRQALRHYGSDYDKPAEVSCCADCGSVSADPAVGFVCFDCGAHVDGDGASHRDVFNYRLSDEAVRRLTARTPEPAVEALNGARVPTALNGALSRICGGNGWMGNVTIVEISYPTAAQLVAKIGRPGFQTLRSIFLHNLIAALPHGIESHTEGERDFLISPDGDLEGIGDELLTYCQENLAERLDPSIRLIKLSNGERESERPAVCH